MAGIAWNRLKITDTMAMASAVLALVILLEIFLVMEYSDTKRN